MDYPGYAGSILYVNLNSGETRREPLDPQLMKAFIGGFGINNKLAYDLVPADVDPLSPANAIIIGTGPFAGTIVPGAGKVIVTTKFPLNGAFGTAHGVGAFALMLKTCGYDHVVITGKADKPIYLNIADNDVALCDAMQLWGMDTFETADELRTRHEPCSVIASGQAGENLVKISVACVDKCATIGTGGLPAVMGSKNLKAIVASQGTKGIEVAHRLKLNQLVDDMLRRIMSWPGREFLLQNGMLPSFGLEELHRETFRVLACPSCPLADKEVHRLTQGPYAGMVTYMTHFMAR